MATPHFVKKARKDIPGSDIKKGDSYYWWKFRYGAKQVSKTKPRRSQLTQSDFYSTLWETEDGLSEQFDEFRDGKTDIEDLRSACDSAADEIENLGSECEDKHSNMPDQLQESETGELLQERAERCSELADSLRSLPDNWEDEPEDEGSEDGELDEDAKREWIDSVADSFGDLDFSID